MPLSYKMKFLNALRRVMKYQREDRGKKVILVGDLNIVYKREDTHWEYRSVHIDRVLKEVLDYKEAADTNVDGEAHKLLHLQNDKVAANGDAKGDGGISKWKLDLDLHWKTIKNALDTMEVVPVTTKNIATGATFEKFRVRVRINDNFTAFLGRAESTKEEALAYFCFPQRTYYDRDLQKEFVSREANVISIDVLAELLSKIAKVEWSLKTLRLISEMDVGCCQSSPHARWLNEVLETDDMVDAFRSSYPNAQGRFTCWNQQSNKRFENKGFRIDYTLLDRSIIGYIDTGPNERLRCCKYPQQKSDTEEASLHAVTASGSFQGASYEGGGIASATQEALDTQFDCPHTGIIYTPPSYSDHVAVSLLLKEDWRQLHMPLKLILDEKDSATKKSQPHKSQKSISSFFGNATSSSKKGIGVSTALTKKSKIKGYFHKNKLSPSQQVSKEIKLNRSPFKRKLHVTRDLSMPKKVKETTKKKNSILNHFSSK